jgi:hypothetical protein
MNWKDEIGNYCDRDGFLCPARVDPMQRPGSGNSLLYMSLYIITLHRRGEMTPEDYAWYCRSVDQFQPPGKRGCFTRGPYSSDKNTSFDDYNALLAASYQIEPTIAFNILKYGNRHLGVYNAEGSWKYTKKQFLWRAPQFMAHMYFANKIRPNWFLRLWWRLCIRNSMKADPKNQDAWIMSWLLVITAAGQDPKCDLVGLQWFNRLFEVFGKEGAEGICARCLEAGHPLGKEFRL